MEDQHQLFGHVMNLLTLSITLLILESQTINLSKKQRLFVLCFITVLI